MAHFEKQSVSCRDYGFPNQYNEQTSTGNRRNCMDGTVCPVRIHSMRSGCIMLMFSVLLSSHHIFAFDFVCMQSPFTGVHTLVPLLLVELGDKDAKSNLTAIFNISSITDQKRHFPSNKPKQASTEHAIFPSVNDIDFPGNNRYTNRYAFHSWTAQYSMIQTASYGLRDIAYFQPTISRVMAHSEKQSAIQCFPARQI